MLAQSSFDSGAVGFPTWAIVELRGEPPLGGLVSEQAIAGAAFLRIDLPEPDGEVSTRFYPAWMVACIRTSTEDQARSLALAQPPSIELVKRVVAAYYRVAPDHLSGKAREQSLTRPRRVAMYLARELTPGSLSAIGRAFGCSQHTTVLRAAARLTRELHLDPGLRRQVAGLRSYLAVAGARDWVERSVAELEP